MINDKKVIFSGIQPSSDSVTLGNYLGALKTIFEKCQQKGVEVVFMTPNMLNTYVADDTAPVHKGYAEQTAHYQLSGKMDLFMSGAVNLAGKMGVKVCDCYTKWKKMQAGGVDTTELLANKLNHPIRELTGLFAYSLLETMLS